MTLNQFLYVNIIHGSEPVDPIHVLKDYVCLHEESSRRIRIAVLMGLRVILVITFPYRQIIPRRGHPSGPSAPLGCPLGAFGTLRLPPRFIPPHSVQKPCTNSPPSCIVTFQCAVPRLIDFRAEQIRNLHTSGFGQSR